MLKLVNNFVDFQKIFWRETKGVAILELAFVIFGLSMFAFLVVDLGRVFAMQSRLDRASYALATTLRERTALYDSREIISDSDVKQIKKLADKLVSGDLAIRVDALYFDTTALAQTIIQTIRIDVPDQEERNCRSRLPDSNSLRKLAPQSKSRWMPIYRVTICRPSEVSWFKSLVNAGNAGAELVVEELIASSIVLPR